VIRAEIDEDMGDAALKRMGISIQSKIEGVRK